MGRHAIIWWLGTVSLAVFRSRRIGFGPRDLAGNGTVDTDEPEAEEFLNMTRVSEIQGALKQRVLELRHTMKTLRTDLDEIKELGGIKQAKYRGTDLDVVVVDPKKDEMEAQQYREDIANIKQAKSSSFPSSLVVSGFYSPPIVVLEKSPMATIEKIMVDKLIGCHLEGFDVEDAFNERVVQLIDAPATTTAKR